MMPERCSYIFNEKISRMQAEKQNAESVSGNVQEKVSFKNFQMVPEIIFLLSAQWNKWLPNDGLWNWENYTSKNTYAVIP